MNRMALAAPSRLATFAGSEVVGVGGTAADAAIAMALIAMCTEPGVCAPGAGGYVTVDAGDGAPVVVDGYMAVPGMGFEGEPVSTRVSMAYGGGVITDVGPGSIAVPGSFAALGLVSQRYGKLPWKELLYLVADLVGRGFPLSQACRTYLVDSGTLIFDKDPATRSALFDGDRLKEVGELVVFEGMGDTLRQIGEEGSSTFYQGDLGASIVADLAARGSSLTRKDLASYRTEVRRPLELMVSGWQIVSNPPPAIGGIAVLGAVQKMVESADPLDAEVWLSSMAEVLGHRDEFETGGATQAGIGEFLERAGLRAPSTITVSAVDGEGIAVAATFSAGYGSGVVPAGTGLLMNNSIGEIELIPGGAGSLVPGQRMMSNMAPTTARSGDNVISIGSPGADRITSALAITLVRFLCSGDTLSAAIEHPRLHPESLEPLGIAAEIGLDLHGAGIRWYAERHMYFGGVNAAGLVAGTLVAHADSRRVGSAVVV